HIGGQAELIQMAAAADEAELGADAELDEVVHFDARAEGHGQLVVPGGAARAEMEQVAALEADVARVAVHGVVLEVELHERVPAGQTGDVVAKVETAPQKLTALIVYAEGVTRRVQNRQAIEAADARMPRQAEVGIDREVAGVLKDLRRAGGDLED